MTRARFLLQQTFPRLDPTVRQLRRFRVTFAGEPKEQLMTAEDSVEALAVAQRQGRVVALRGEG